jgi:type I restriction enzyme S subunit
MIEQYIKENFYNNTDVRISAINELGKVQGGYAFKSKDLLDEITNNKIFKIKNIGSNGVDINNTQYIYDEVADKVDKKFLLNRGDVIVAMTGAELGKTGYLYGNRNKFFLNQRVGVIRGNNEKNSLYLKCIFLLEEMKNSLNSKGYGSAQPNISSSDIEKIEIPIPDEIELNNFYNIAKPIYDKMILNSEENQYLSQLRDTLLPKLMNGEIDLDKIEI